jgi:hypothetical membrane protein
MTYWWVIASVMANAAIIAVECLNRTQPSLGDAMVRTWPLIVLAQVGLYFSWHHAPHMMVAWLVFTVGNSIMRVIATTSVLGEPMKIWWVLLGIALMFAGSLAIKQGTTQ